MQIQNPALGSATATTQSAADNSTKVATTAYVDTKVVVAPAGTLTGTTLASNVVTSSLTSVGTLTGLTVGGTNPIISMTGSTSNALVFPRVGIAPPALNSRSAGTKIVLYSDLNPSDAEYAMGIDAGTMWFSVPDSFGTFKFYAGTTKILACNGVGNLESLGTMTARGMRISDKATNDPYQLVQGGNVTTAAKPHYTWSGQESTCGMYLKGNSVIGFGTAATERLVIDSNGDVNINNGMGLFSGVGAAAFSVTSTTQGVKFPNMTTTQRNAITSPMAGLVVYDTTLAELCVYTSSWQPASVTTGIIDGSTATAGRIGEVISATVASGSAVAMTSGQSKDFISITLTAGDWDINAVGILTGAGLGVIYSTYIFIGTASGNNTTGQDAAANTFNFALGLGADTSGTISWNVNITSTTTYYLKAFVDAAAISAFGTIRARRMR